MLLVVESAIVSPRPLEASFAARYSAVYVTVSSRDMKSPITRVLKAREYVADTSLTARLRHPGWVCIMCCTRNPPKRKISHPCARMRIQRRQPLVSLEFAKEKYDVLQLISLVGVYVGLVFSDFLAVDVYKRYDIASLPLAEKARERARET